MPGLPPPFERCFCDLNTVIEDLHTLFDVWMEDDTYTPLIEDFGVHVMKLAIHEWIANLVQHASFEAPTPEICLCISVEGEGLRCTVEDNSDGFDFNAQVSYQESTVKGPKPGERGRGLLMMIACTDDLRYDMPAAGRQRVSFLVLPSIDPEGMAPLFAMPSSELPTSHASDDARGGDDVSSSTPDCS